MLLLILPKTYTKKVRERTVWRAFLAANTARAKARRLELDWSIFSTVAEWSEEEVMSEELR